MIEIERKFLVLSQHFIDQATSKKSISQGFLNSHPDRCVRIRKTQNGGMITVKGRSSEDGTSRFEWEKPLSSTETQQLLALCEPGLIEKDRYLVPVGNHLFEVDVFKGVNKGLIIAEIELKSAEESFEKPSWLGEEVTGDPKYYNASLSNCPFNEWG